MSQGLQVWDENRNIILDTNDRITRFIAKIPVERSKDFSYIYSNDIFKNHNIFLHFNFFNSYSVTYDYRSIGIRSVNDDDIISCSWQVKFDKLSDTTIKIYNVFYDYTVYTRYKSGNSWSGSSSSSAMSAPAYIEGNSFIPTYVLIGVY